MVEKEKIKLKKYVLRDVNKIREVLSLKPLSKLPKGKPLSRNSCPIANSLKSFKKNIEIDVTASSINISFTKDYICCEFSFSCSPALSVFVRAYDNNNFEELIA